MKSFVEFNNFFQDPDKIRKFALSQKYYCCDDHPNGGSWPGIRTEFYHTLSEEMYYDFTGRFYDLMGWDNSKETYFECMFQVCTEKDGTSWIHSDKMVQDFTHVLLIYLTPNPQKDSGTILFDLKEGVDTEALAYKEDEANPKYYNVNAITTNEYNKAILYNPSSFHKSDTYFGNDIYDGRLTLIAFIREEGAKSNFSQPVANTSGVSELGFDEIPKSKVISFKEASKSISDRFSPATREDKEAEELPRENEKVEEQPRKSDSKELTIFDYDSNEEEWERKYLTPDAISHEWDLMVDELGHAGYSNLFKWRLFTEEFCSEIIDLCENEGKWTQKRHEFYPTTDMLLNTVKINDVYEKVLRKHCYPAAMDLYALEGKNWDSLNGENFIIKYKSDGQPHLSLHHDYSKITFLTNLTQHGVHYEGGGTYFRRQKLLHKGNIGEVTMHPGNITHKHGARPTTKGTRYVIVSFCNTNE